MPTNDSNPNISDPFWISGRPLFRDSVVEARNNNYRIRDAGERSVERSKSLVALRRQGLSSQFDPQQDLFDSSQSVTLHRYFQPFRAKVRHQSDVNNA